MASAHWDTCVKREGQMALQFLQPWQFPLNSASQPQRSPVFTCPIPQAHLGRGKHGRIHLVHLSNPYLPRGLFKGKLGRSVPMRASPQLIGSKTTGNHLCSWYLLGWAEAESPWCKQKTKASQGTQSPRDSMVSRALHRSGVVSTVTTVLWRARVAGDILNISPSLHRLAI